VVFSSPNAYPFTLQVSFQGYCMFRWEILAALGAGFYYFLTRPAPVAAAPPEPRLPAEYTLDGAYLERRFYQGDSILIPLGEDQFKLELVNLEEAVTIATPVGNKILDLGQDATVDLNQDGFVDIRITAADFVKHESDSGALLRFDLDFGLALGDGNTAAPTAALGTVSPAAGTRPETVATAPVVFSSPNAYPFTLQVSFQGYCMFRWEILAERDRRDRNEQYFQRSDELNIQAQNGIRMWVSNAATVKIQVIGGGRTVPLEIGGVGEVVVADVRWVRDEDGRFRLILLRLE
jgi:hypothetical protein